MIISNENTDQRSVNMNPRTGIHFGVISQHKILQAWADSSEALYVYYCPKCSTILKRKSEAKICSRCRYKIQEHDFDMMEPSIFHYSKEGYWMEQRFDDPDIFVIRSPYYTKCRLCSPCAPNAGDLSAPDDLGVRTYCLAKDWFDENKAPYHIYSVKNFLRSKQGRLKYVRLG
jgi:ribosomal protein L37AE/L43A